METTTISSIRGDCFVRHGSSCFSIKESDYVLSDVRWSGGAVCPRQGVLGKGRFSLGGGGGSEVKIISQFGDIICSHSKAI